MNSRKVRPCPYCGGSFLTLGENCRLGTFYTVCCDCWMQGPQKKSEDEARVAWNAIPRTPKWTSETPTKPGWYFTRRNRPGKPLRVVYVKEEKRYDHRVKEERKFMTMAETRSKTGYIIEELNQDDRQWAGPIMAPKEKN